MEGLMSLGSERSKPRIVKNPQLKQAFGKSKLFEIRRLVRRIKQLSMKKGSTQQLEKNKRKVSRLEKQLEVLKDFHVDTFIKAAAAKIQGEELDCENVMSTTADDEDADTKINVLERLLDIVGLDKIKDLSSGVKAEKRGVKSNRNEKTKRLKTVKKLPKKLSSNNTSSSFSPKKLRKISKTSYSDEELHEELETSEADTEMKKKLENLDDFFSDPVAQDCNPAEVGKTHCKSTFTTERSHKKRKLNIDDDFEEVSHKAFDSLFIGSLKSGKQQKNGKSKGKNVKEKSDNRLGQRGRRKEWEKLYGKKANHLKNEKKKLENSNKGDRKKLGYKPFQDRKKKNFDEKTNSSLHPSWEASKSKRKQESIVEFKGQKIIFED